MNLLVILPFILFHSFYEAACSNFNLRRQDNDTSVASLNATMVQLGIPVVCYGNCSSPVNQTANCLDATCECTTDYEQAVFNCYLCVSVTLDLGFDAAQEKINRIYEQCNRLGYNLPLLLYPGETDISAAPFTSTSTTFPHLTQSFTSQPQATQGTSGDSPSPNDGNDPEPTPDLSGFNFPDDDPIPNGGMKLTPGILLSGGLMLLRILIFQRW